jgi:lysophospholipase L1-like esterase
MRILFAVCTAVALTALGCSKDGTGGSPTGPSGPPPTATPVGYSAVGASDVLGIGSSSPCFIFEDCNGNGYVWVAARQLRGQGYTVNVSNLGIPAGVISRQFQELGAQNGRTIGGNMIEQEMPFVRSTATLVTIFTGANEVNVLLAALSNGAGGSDPAAYIDQKVAAFASDFVTLVEGIRSQARSARIVVLNLPNMAALPYLSGATLTQKQAAQRIAVRMTTTAINTVPNVTVIDLMCDGRVYQPSTFSSDGFHPNDAGYATFGDEIVKAFTNSSYPAPRSSCSQMTMF